MESSNINIQSRNNFWSRIVSCSFYLLSITYSIETGKSELSEYQSAIDIKHYYLDLRVDPYKKTLSGIAKIKFNLLRDVPYIELDLLNSYHVSGATINGTSLTFHHEKNKLFIRNQGVHLFKDNRITIKYGGRPPTAKNPPWDGGVTWSKDSYGRHWVGVSCQINGAHYWYPCKNHPSDKSNGAEILITVPPALMAVSNGLIQSYETLEDRWVRWHWKTNYPISTYNINFTIGNFQTLEKQVYIDDSRINMFYYMIDDNTDRGYALLNQGEEYLRFFSTYFGDYPWSREKLGIVEAPYWGMEHQTIIAYGNKYKQTDLGYDFILLHEMGHEWWGNYVSVIDWSDFWIHEGFTTYAEAMFVEQKYGIKVMRDQILNSWLRKIENKRPLVGQKNSQAINMLGTDAYYKGAYVLHMLRELVGKELLWSTLYEYISMPKEYENNQTSTNEFIKLINNNSGKELGWFFQKYLYSESMPVLIVEEVYTNDKNFIDIYWEDDNFIMPVEISYTFNENTIQKTIPITNKPYRMVTNSSSSYKVDPNKNLLLDMKLLKKESKIQ